MSGQEGCPCRAHHTRCAVRGCVAYLLLGAQVGLTDRQSDPPVRVGLRPAARNVAEAGGGADGGKQAAWKTDAGRYSAWVQSHSQCCRGRRRRWRQTAGNPRARSGLRR